MWVSDMCFNIRACISVVAAASPCAHEYNAVDLKQKKKENF